MLKNVLCLASVISLILISTIAVAETASIKIDDVVPRSTKDEIAKDFSLFANIFPDAGILSREWAALDGSENDTYDYHSLSNWLTARVRFLVPDKFPVKSRLVYGRKRKKTGLGEAGGNYRLESSGAIMINIGLVDYKNSKSSGYEASYRLVIDGALVQVPIESPRVGVVKIEKDFLSSSIYKNVPAKLDSSVFSILRMATLYHEGRHSDGNGQSLGFSHTVCPEGHDFAGVEACDLAQNGDYKVKALIIDFALKACAANSSLPFCTSKGKTFLYTMKADSLARILVSEDAENWDGTPEWL